MCLTHSDPVRVMRDPEGSIFLSAKEKIHKQNR